MTDNVLILGCGFTGIRLAKRLLARGCRVMATTREPTKLAGLGVEVVEPGFAPPGCRVLHSIPSLEGGADARMLDPLRGLASRVVYLSTTGVYGAVTDVDENTTTAPRNVRERARVETENAVLDGSWEALVLRPAAIYGPGRGVHVSMRNGQYFLPPENHFISRIHVDDLAAHVEAALFSSVTGAFPVADEHPCRSSEIAAFCAELLEIPPPGLGREENIPETRRSNRKVNGAAIRRLLGVRLVYPSYREGVPACIAAELRTS